MHNQAINVLHVLGCLDARIGGPAQSVERLVECSNEFSVKADVWTFNYPYRDKQIFLKNNTQHFVSPDFFLSRKLAAWNPWACHNILAMASRYDLIHNHGHWLFGNAYASLAAKKLNKPLIISSRGMLEPWALAHHSLSKKLAFQIFERKNMATADLFHATSGQEAVNMRRLGIKQPIAVIPNGVDLADNFLHFAKPPQKQILFLSRIDVKKGLERLFLIWQRQAIKFKGWELVVAGDGPKSYVNALKKYVIQLGIQEHVRWTGFVQGSQKERLFEDASVFVLPTFSENFGNSILEAMSYGVPVITTRAAPWEELNVNQCGWCVDNNEQALEQAVVNALSCTESKLFFMGKNAGKLAQEKYSWGKVTKDMADTYSWILNQGDKPSCVGYD